MRILLDECVPVALKRNVIALGHECQTAVEAGFAGKKNGELFTLAERRWDVLLTTDRKIEFQQHIIGRKIGILVLGRKPIDCRIFCQFCRHARKHCAPFGPVRL